MAQSKIEFAAVSSVLSLALLAFANSQAHAAVRRCGPMVISQIAAGTSLPAAKAKALAHWRASAVKVGAGFDSWRLAADKTIKCYPKSNGAECVAVGKPCIIEHKARPLLPRGSKRDAI